MASERDTEVPMRYLGEVSIECGPADSVANQTEVPMRYLGEVVVDCSQRLAPIRSFVVVFRPGTPYAPLELRASKLLRVPETPTAVGAGCFVLSSNEGGSEKIVGVFSQAEVVGVFEGTLEWIRPAQPTAA